MQTTFKSDVCWGNELVIVVIQIPYACDQTDAQSSSSYKLEEKIIVEWSQ
jgi:hypothetical protein